MPVYSPVACPPSLTARLLRRILRIAPANCVWITHISTRRSAPHRREATKRPFIDELVKTISARRPAFLAEKEREGLRENQGAAGGCGFSGLALHPRPSRGQAQGTRTHPRSSQRVMLRVAVLSSRQESAA